MSSWLATGVRYQMPPVAEHCRHGYCPGTALAAVAAFADAAAAEVAPAGVEIHRVGSRDTEIAAYCAGRHRLGPRRVACMCPVGRVLRRCHVLRRVLCREACVRLAVGIGLAAVVASNVASLGVAHAIATSGLLVGLAFLFPCSWVVAATSVGAGSASEGAAAAESAAHLPHCLREFPPFASAKC